MRASASQLALVLLLIGWKGGANLLSQSHRVESAKPITFRHSNENRSIVQQSPKHHLANVHPNLDRQSSAQYGQNPRFPLAYMAQFYCSTTAVASIDLSSAKFYATTRLSAGTNHKVFLFTLDETIICVSSLEFCNYNKMPLCVNICFKTSLPRQLILNIILKEFWIVFYKIVRSYKCLNGSFV